jgi:hypothetical protein
MTWWINEKGVWNVPQKPVPDAVEATEEEAELKRLELLQTTVERMDEHNQFVRACRFAALPPAMQELFE